MITWSNSEAFWLIPVCALIAWRMPQAGIQRPLRLAVLILFALAWANPQIQRLQPGVDLWVLLDQSDSVQQFSTASTTQEAERILREGRGPHDRLFVVDVAEEAWLRDPEAPEVLTGQTGASRLGHAIQVTLSMRKPNRAARLLYIGDGFATDRLDRAAERLLAEEIPLDLRLSTPDLLQDVRLEEVEAPARVRPGEPFLVEAWIAGPRGARFEVRFHRDGQEIDRKEIALGGGRERLRWATELRRPGASRYTVSIDSEGDPIPGNNYRQVWVEAGGGNRVLLITAYADDPIRILLESLGVEVETVTDPQNLSAGVLSGAGAVWIHNVHAAALPRELQEALDFYVREQGGGLVMVGGASSFGSGGYHESPIDPLLPVSMELKEEDRKQSIALAIVLDRSGSMSAGAGGGMSKMDLANAGSARAIELLGDMDAVTVFAVDTQAHTIVPLTRVGEQRAKLAGLVRRIQSSGGGIYVFNGLEAAWKEMQNAPQTQRHIILFADAADAEQPEGVGELIKEMVSKNTTVSVIALGTASDPDAPFLMQIAEDGQGRLFFNADASTLPAVFAQETVSVSRSAFLEEPTGTEATAGWRELAPHDPDWPSAVDGYNLNYLREDAAQSLVSTDEYAAPLVAHWQRGRGRVAAVAMPLGGPFSQQMREWSGVGDMVNTLNRWMVRGEWPSGLSLQTERVGDSLRVTLQADREWQDRFALEPPELKTQWAETGKTRLHAWRRIAPGRLQTDIELDAAARMRGVVQIGQTALPFGPVSGQPGTEWEFDREQVAQLRTLSLSSKGRELTSLSEAWLRPPQTGEVSTRMLWLWLAISMFLLEAFWSRLAGEKLSFAFRRDTTSPVQEVPEVTEQSEQVTEREPAPRSAFQRAKRR